MTPRTLEWLESHISPIVYGPIFDAIEIGSYNVNGSLRDAIEPMAQSYIGIDIKAGPGVDRVENLFDVRGEYGVVICTETLEHVEAWERALAHMKSLVAPYGYIILTTRAPGFPKHDFPRDFWRFTIGSLCDEFIDWDIVAAKQDSEDRGVYLIARKIGG